MKLYIDSGTQIKSVINPKSLPMSFYMYLNELSSLYKERFELRNSVIQGKYELEQLDMDDDILLKDGTDGVLFAIQNLQPDGSKFKKIDSKRPAFIHLCEHDNNIYQHHELYMID